jgi:hypothetical protein
MDFATRRRGAVVLAAAAAGAVFGGALLGRAQARGPSTSAGQAGWRTLVRNTVRQQGGISAAAGMVFGRGGATGQAVTAPNALRLDPDDVVTHDLDQSGDITAGDTITSDGVLVSQRGLQVGLYEFTETFTREGSVGTVQLLFPGQGTLVLGGGTAQPDGTRSRSPVRAVFGGTGRYQSAGGQVAYVSDGTDLFVILNAR